VKLLLARIDEFNKSIDGIGKMLMAYPQLDRIFKFAKNGC
tara:strand:- start:63 stop:182 length:120 start_codon:yes stop_codon:yes gene_type:complete